MFIMKIIVKKHVCDFVFPPNFIIIENKQKNPLVFSDCNGKTITLPYRDKIIGEYSEKQVIKFDSDEFYCRQIGFIVYITNQKDPDWKDNFFLACGGISKLLDRSLLFNVYIENNFLDIFNQTVVDMVELHFKYNFDPKPLETPLIPHIIHMIWLKGKYEFQKGYLENWAELHPNFEIFLWTDYDDIPELPKNVVIKSIDIDNKHYHNIKILGIKSDILRYIVLQKYGGIYVDINDFECFKSIESLTYQYDFIAGAETCYADNMDCVLVNNAFIACTKNHEIINRLLRIIDQSQFDDTHKNLKELDDAICRFSGPILFRSVVLGYLIDPTIPNKNRTMVLPSVYLYPSCFYDVDEEIHINAFKIEKEKWMHSVSYAAHYSDHSYL